MTKNLFGILILLCFCISTQAQIQGNAAAIPQSTNTTGAFSVIKVTVSYEKDSTGYVVNCSVVEGTDGIKLIVNKYQGLTCNFHRSMSKPMFTKNLDTVETYIDIKTIFSGIYYLDIIDTQGVKIKTFTIEKNF